jgi:ATP-dependent Clp protease ATP-binding subunit ClpA
VSIFAEKESHAVYLLKLNNISRLEVMEAISTQMPELEEESPKIKSRPKKGKKSALESYTVNLCEKAKTGGIDPLLGREEEVLRTIQILRLHHLKTRNIIQF